MTYVYMAKLYECKQKKKPVKPHNLCHTVIRHPARTHSEHILKLHCVHVSLSKPGYLRL